MSEGYEREFKLISQPTFASSATDSSLPSLTISQESDHESEYEDAVTSPEFHNVVLRSHQNKIDLKSVRNAGILCGVCARRAFDGPLSSEAEACETCVQLFLQHYEHDRVESHAAALKADEVDNDDAPFTRVAFRSAAGLGIRHFEQASNTTIPRSMGLPSPLHPVDDLKAASDTSTIAPSPEESFSVNPAHNAADSSSTKKSKEHPCGKSEKRTPYPELREAASTQRRMFGLGQPIGPASRQTDLAFKGIGSVFQEAPLRKRLQSPALSSSRQSTSDSGYGSVWSETNSCQSNALASAPDCPSRTPALQRPNWGEGLAQNNQIALTLQLQNLTLDTGRPKPQTDVFDPSKPRAIVQPNAQPEMPVNNRIGQSSGSTSPSYEYTYSPVEAQSPLVTQLPLPPLTQQSHDIRSCIDPQGSQGQVFPAGTPFSQMREQTGGGFPMLPNRPDFGLTGSGFSPNANIGTDQPQSKGAGPRFDCPARKEHPERNNCCTKKGFQNASRVKEHLDRKHAIGSCCMRCWKNHSSRGNCTGPQKPQDRELFPEQIIKCLEIRHKFTDAANWWEILFALFGERERQRPFDCWHDPSLNQYYREPTEAPNDSGFAPGFHVQNEQYLTPDRRRDNNMAPPSEGSNGSSGSASRSAGSSLIPPQRDPDTPSTDTEQDNPCARRGGAAQTFPDDRFAVDQLLQSHRHTTATMRNQRRQLLSIANDQIVDNSVRSKILETADQCMRALLEDP